MTIRDFDSVLYRQLQLCLEGDYVSTAADTPSAATLAGVRRSLDVATVGRQCDCGEPWCRSFRVAGTTASRESLRIRFRVYGELSVCCTPSGEIQRVEWLPDPPHGEREVGVCPYPE